jgi:ubiquinone/menaquinone biosynthesis C-methylase UbiE
MATRAGIDQNSKLLDMGCGNGTTAMWLGRTRGCQIVGVDLSGVRINNAMEAMEKESDVLRERMRFEKASAIDLRFEDGLFTHVWSQATIYHIPDKVATLREAYRVLADGGIFIFDDLIKPKPDISDAARTHVYDRLLFDTYFSFHSYQDALQEAAFHVLEAQDLSTHLRTSYLTLARITREKGDEHDGKYKALSLAYEQMAKAQENSELGWGMYLCQK